MRVPKQRLYRAIHKAGLATPEQLKIINKKLGNDKKAQQGFLKVWRNGLGHRFVSRLNSLTSWVIEHWDEIKIALGIAALFLDEEPEEVKEEKKPEPKTYVAPPKPKKQRESKAKTQEDKVTEELEVAVEKQIEADVNKVVYDEDYKDGTLWSPGK